jgi:hypothetical protein
MSSGTDPEPRGHTHPGDHAPFEAPGNSPVSPTPVTTGGTKNDQGKDPLELLPFIALRDVSKVLAFGAKKYAPNNWRKGMRWTRPIGAALRHAFSWLAGEDLDPETGLSHLSHMACEVLFALEYVLTGMGEDDRYGRGGK